MRKGILGAVATFLIFAGLTPPGALALPPGAPPPTPEEAPDPSFPTPMVPNLGAPALDPADNPIAPPVAPLSPPHAPRVWGSAEYLLWWTKVSPVPVPLVTSASPDAFTSGAIGQPGTAVLLGGTNVATAAYLASSSDIQLKSTATPSRNLQPAVSRKPGS